jgi:alkanesulfonate monooxygenase SsuD/methylene tetrahydromethanopterin reductase-like flavin-dependent oxidoreductase (luciferase family)
VLTRLGLVVPGAASSGDENPLSLDRVSESVAVAETSGFDSIWALDNPPVIGGREDPLFEAYTLLGALALRTSSARLGALVTGVTSRPPALLAKQVTTLDVLSAGRAVLGVGAGHLDPYDIDPGEIDPGEPSVGLTERFERLEEALQVFRAMFTQDPVSFEGRHYQLHDAVNRPRPIQDGGPPVLIGGGGEHQTLRLAAEYADACNLSGDLSTIRRKIRVLESHCVASGRDPSSITKTMLATLVVAPSESQASARVEELGSLRIADEMKTSVIAGSPDAVTQQVANFVEAGIEGFIVMMPDFQEPDFVALAGTTVSQSF